MSLSFVIQGYKVKWIHFGFYYCASSSIGTKNRVWQSTKLWSTQSAQFKVGRSSHHLSIWLNVEYGHKFPRLLLNYGQKSVFVEHHDVTVKLTFDLFGYKIPSIHRVITLHTFVWNFDIIRIHVLDLWRPKSNQFTLESKWTLVPNLEKFPEGILEFPEFTRLGRTSGQPGKKIK